MEEELQKYKDQLDALMKMIDSKETEEEKLYLLDIHDEEITFLQEKITELNGK